jgi:hypothetical protein
MVRWCFVCCKYFWVTVTARNWKLFVRKAKMFGSRIVGLLLQIVSGRGKSGIWDLNWTKQRTYNVTLRRVCATFVAVENIGVKYSELVFVALGIQHAKRMRRVVLLSLTSPDLQHFSTISYKRHDFRKKSTEHKMCVFYFIINFVWNISHSKEKLARYNNKCTIVWCIVSFILVKFSLNFNFLNRILHIKCNKPSSVSRVVPCGRTDGQTDRHDEANGSFSQ